MKSFQGAVAAFWLLVSLWPPASARKKTKNDGKVMSKRSNGKPRQPPSEAPFTLADASVEECFDFCSDGNDCTQDILPGMTSCQCDDFSEHFEVDPGFGCCADGGIAVVEDACCPIGVDVCCGLSMEACQRALFPFSFQVDQDIFGSPFGGLPIYYIEDETIRSEAPESYTALRGEDQEFQLVIHQVLRTGEYMKNLVVSSDPELVEEYEDLYLQSQLLSFIVNASIDGGSTNFIALVSSVIEMEEPSVFSYFIMLEDAATFDQAPSLPNRWLFTEPASCSEAVNEAQKTCPNEQSAVPVNECLQDKVAGCQDQVNSHVQQELEKIQNAQLNYLDKSLEHREQFWKALLLGTFSCYERITNIVLLGDFDKIAADLSRNAIPAYNARQNIQEILKAYGGISKVDRNKAFFRVVVVPCAAASSAVAGGLLWLLLEEEEDIRDSSIEAATRDREVSVAFEKENAREVAAQCWECQGVPTAVPSLEPTSIPSAIDPPPNDGCQSAALVTETVTIGTLVGATVKNFDETACSFDGIAVFYSFVGTGKPFRIYVCNDFYPRFRLFTGGCDNTNCDLTNYDANVVLDVTCSYINGPDTYPRQINTVPGQLYYVVVGTLLLGNGEYTRSTFELVVEELNPPSNDQCDDAIGPLPTDGTGAVGTLVDSSFTLQSCATPRRYVRGVWYYVHGTGSTLTVSVQGGRDNGTRSAFVAIRQGDCNNLQCVRTGVFSEMSFPTLVGENYYFYVYLFENVQTTGDPPSTFSISVAETP